MVPEMADFCVEGTTPLSDPGIPHDNPVAAVQRPPFRDALRFWFKLGWIYTFLPCFLFVFAGAPLVDQTQGKQIIQGVLGLITAVVVGAILDLTLFLGKAVIFPS